MHQLSFFHITGQNNSIWNENSYSPDGSVEIMQGSQNLHCTGPKRVGAYFSA